MNSLRGFGIRLHRVITSSAIHALLEGFNFGQAVTPVTLTLRRRSVGSLIGIVPTATSMMEGMAGIEHHPLSHEKEKKDVSKVSIDGMNPAVRHEQTVSGVAGDSSPLNASQDGGSPNGERGGEPKKKRKKTWTKYKNKKKKQVKDKIENKPSSMKSWTKKYDADNPVTPHLGSFAHPDMQKQFGVEVTMPSKDVSGEANGAATESAAEEKVPKRKLAALIGFLGSKYSGFQVNPAKRTLQAEIELALFRSGILSATNFGHPSKCGWSNSARTDKGVHAASQVCSFKGEMICWNDQISQDEQMEKMRLIVNSNLPSDIQVLDIKRTTRSFCSRTARDKVRYQYMVPSFLLIPPDEAKRVFVDVKAEEFDRNDPEKNLNDVVKLEMLQSTRGTLADYRVTNEQVEKLRRSLQVFEGTKSFHNYTRKLSSSDASTSRFIMKFTALEPVIMSGLTNEDGSKSSDSQWVPVQITGQSFLLNQIRKMVSAAVDLARGAATHEQIEQSFSRQNLMKVDVAPAQGLFLDRSSFELYNEHKVKNAAKSGGENIDRDTLDWFEVEGKELSPAVQRTEKLKNDTIIPHIVKEETEEGNFIKYLYTHDVLFNDTYQIREVETGPRKKSDMAKEMPTASSP